MRAPFLLPNSVPSPGSAQRPQTPSAKRPATFVARVLELGVAGVSTVMLPVCGHRFTRQHSFPSFLWLRLNITVLLSSVQEVYRLPRGKGGVCGCNSITHTGSDHELCGQI